MYFRYTQHISLLTKNDKQTLKTGVACSIQLKLTQNLGSELLTEGGRGVVFITLELDIYELLFGHPTSDFLHFFL